MLHELLGDYDEDEFDDDEDGDQTTSAIQRDQYIEKTKNMPLHAVDFVAGRKEHMEILAKMGKLDKK